MPRTILCLGNPGAEYSTTRHNVGWWLADRVAQVHDLGRFRQDGAAAVASGVVESVEVRVVKPLTYMNRSGAALAPFAREDGFLPERDLLVVVDDVALPPGRARLRTTGSAGGHNGLKSVEATLGTRDYPRLRIGVGGPPEEVDLVDWVLASPPREERQLILALFPDVLEGIALWLRGDVEAAMRRCNAAGREEGADEPPADE